MTDDQLAAQGRIQLLLEEYRTLRAESLARIGSRFTLTSVFAAGIALIVSKDLPAWWPVVVGGLALVLLVVWGYSLHLLSNISKHLKTLEGRINQEAVEAYGAKSDLLTWETRGH